MKMAVAAVILVVLVALLFVLSRIGNGTDQDQAKTPPPQSKSGGDTKPTSPALLVMPNTTVIDGKTVPLKSYPSGLKYYDTVVGTGPSPKPGQKVSMLYTGSLLDGSVFDSTDKHGGQPFDFAVGTGQVIKGWDEGVLPMKVGGKRRLVVPGNLAYGAQSPSPAIPANATLVFDVQLVKLK